MKTKKIVIFVCVFMFLVVGISGAGFDPDTIGEFTDAGAELVGSNTLQFGEGLYDIGNLIGELESTDISVSNVRIEKKEESNKITFLKDGNVNIKGDLFENVEELSRIELGDNGEVISADLTASEDTVFVLGGKENKVLAGQTITLKDGKITLKGGDSYEYKEEGFDEFTKVDFLGESLEIEKDLKGNSIFTGDFTINGNEIKGLENNIGKATLSKNGEIIEIGKDTKATINGIECSVSGDNVKTSYNENFDLSKCQGNCLNFGDSIALGGDDFTVNLGEANTVFGDMETEKYIDGQKDPKTRNLEITLNGGVVEIEKDSSKDYLAFKAQANGDYVIYDGRTIIEGDYSERGLVKKDGKTTISDQSKIFVKASEDKEGQLYSYDLTLNEGEYFLENNIFTDKKGNELFNANKPWENVIRKSQKLVINPEKRYPTLTEEGKKIYDKVEEETGARPRFYGLVNQENEENLAKLPCKVVEIVNQNTLNTKIGVEELHHVFNLEMGGLEAFQEAIKADPGREILGISIGLDTFGGVDHSFEKSKGFFPPDFNPSELETFEWLNEKDEKVTSVVFENIEQAYTALAGEYAYRKYQSIKLYGKYYGEEEKNKLTKDQEILLAYYNYNCGIGCLESALKNKNAEDKIFKAWDKEDDSSYVNNPRLNNHRLLASIKFSQESGIFNSP